MSSRREKYFGAVSPGGSPKALFRNAALAEAVDHLAGQADAGVVRRDVLRRCLLYTSYCREQVDTLWDEVKRFDNPHTYYVDLSQKLWEIKYRLLKDNACGEHHA